MARAAPGGKIEAMGATETSQPWRHDHGFGHDRRKPGERRTLAVALVTAATMAVELVAGAWFGSMALLADGLHMASHALALGIAAFAYTYARRHAHDPCFSFGTGKVDALAGFGGAVLLAGFAAVMAFESLARLFHPIDVQFEGALAVAAVGLVVNAACAWILAAPGQPDGHRHDHNLRAAYLHVLADALTSLLAIAALLGGMLLGATWLDPTMGLVGAALVGRWSAGLLRDSGAVLLDRQAPDEVREAIRAAIERDGEDRVTDLHVWAVGPAQYAAEIVVLSRRPRSPASYKEQLPATPRLVHVTVEVHGEVAVADA